MGAQDEYLRNFCILLTDKGVVPLTDPLQIAVYNSLLGGMKRPSDLAAELNLSSSSLHFIIDKMSESGIVTRTKPETDKKTVYYSISAELIASSTETNDGLRDISQRTFDDPLRNYQGLSSLSNMFDCYASEIGLDLEPVKMKYADALADSLPVEKKSMEDAILDIREMFSKMTGFNFTVFSFSPLTLVVTGDETLRSRSAMMMRFIARLVRNSTGRSFRVSSIEQFNNSDNMMKVTFERCEDSEGLYINTTLHHKDDDSFILMDLDGSAGLMTSDVQIEIIDAIYERPLSITSIVEKVNAPRSTITSNLLRMVEEGVISVFYAESGSAYYGLSCSILLKKTRAMSSDNDEINKVLDSLSVKEGAFMEGYLLYTLAYMKKLGFDSEYLMVVLGAKYMRAVGSMDHQGNFDTYFGKMSDIAKAIGLSLNIVTVYPLTIGISTDDPDSGMYQAMTFIKGMAHQGLEMASSGIFVRSTEETPATENISFKEIYPALSMTPVKGVKVENLAEPTTKKRTSSVKTALFNRSKKENGQPARTVRYITAVAAVVMLLAVVMFATMDTGTTDLDAEIYCLTVDDDLDVVVYDEDDNILSYPYNVEAGSTVYLTLNDPTDIGYVDGGYAYLMTPDDNGRYSIPMGADIKVEPLYSIEDMKDMNCSFSIYCASSKINDTSVALEDSARYEAKTNGLYVSKNNMIKIYAEPGYYVSTADSDEDRDVFESYKLCSTATLSDVRIMAMPDTSTKTIYLSDGSWKFNGKEVENVIEVDADVEKAQFQYMSDGDVQFKMNGRSIQPGPDNTIEIDLPQGDIKLTAEHKNLIP